MSSQGQSVQAIASYTATDPKVATLAIGSLLGAGMFVIMLVSGICMIIKVRLFERWK